MLVSRQFDTEYSHWPFNRHTSSPHKPQSHRMSNCYDPELSTPTDWQNQYPYLERRDSNVFSQSFGQNNNEIDSLHPRPSTEHGSNPLGIHVKKEPASPLAGEGSQQSNLSSPTSKLSNMVQDDLPGPVATGSIIVRSPAEAEACRLSFGSDPLSSVSSALHGSELSPGHRSQRARTASSKDEDEVEYDEEDAIEMDGDLPGQTAAERAAARRKMKRFRLTHQQTRFLMSEFAKQPHPDAAHRERLSREIPGLSPRQVQVWFQNRRAKIKRLNADDRDRMIKMRAVPDGFDNVQALHSPYGAVHGLGTPMASPMEFNSQTYAEHMIRPLVVDVRRPDGDDHMSPAGFSPGFGGLGFGSAGRINHSGMISPLSQSPHGSYSYGSSITTPPLSSGSRTSNPFGHQNNLDVPMDLDRQPMRLLQPLHLRDPLSRARTDNLQSPLRTSMSWKGETMDYSSYQSTNTSPTLSQQHQSTFQPGQLSAFDTSSNAFSGNTNRSPTSGSRSALQSPDSRTRLRAVSASIPLNLDFRNQNDSSSSAQNSSLPCQPRPTPSSQYTSTSIFTSSYSSGPLTAPVDFSPQKSLATRFGAHACSPSQMSAPLAPGSDFSQALQASQPSKPQMSNTFVSDFRAKEASNGRGNGMSGSETHKRKRSLTLPTGSSRSMFGSGGFFPEQTP